MVTINSVRGTMEATDQSGHLYKAAGGAKGPMVRRDLIRETMPESSVDG